VRICDPSSGTQTQQHDGHTDSVRGVAWSPDGTRLASASYDGSVRIWSSNGEHRLTARLGQAVRDVAWADDTTLALAYDNAFMVYDLIDPS
jgi:WD40 repeat protein